MKHTVLIELDRTASKYEIAIAGGSLPDVGQWAKRVKPDAYGKLAIISNKKVFGIYGESVTASLTAAGFAVSVFLMGDGERFKSFRTLENTLRFLADNKFSRTDTVLALGGGVVGDLAGFAASVYLRGISFLQVPTTLLAMIDSSVGGKTAVNTANGKNLIGSFYQPDGVLIVPDVLKTLPCREFTAGLCEAVKQAALAGGATFSNLRRFLDAYSIAEREKSFDKPEFLEYLTSIIAAQVKFKAAIVRGDEQEDPARSDPASRKILNFGHTLAHAIEKVTSYRYLKHGEAVGYGILFAAELSKKLELMTANEVELLNDVVHRAGVLPPIGHLDPQVIIESFKYDKKVVNESLRWVLLRGIGDPVIIPQNDIPQTLLISTLKRLIGQ